MSTSDQHVLPPDHPAWSEIARLREALHFYSDGFAYLTPEGWKRIWRDGGQTARDALRAEGSPTP